MRASAERLAEIDRELDAFGKSEDELRAVVERARSWAASVDDLDADLAALAQDAHEAAARASATRDSEVSAAPSEPAPHSSDIAGLSVDELFADAEPSAGSDSNGLADLFDDVHASTGAPLDDGLGDLFDDELTASSRSGLADLFDDEEPDTGATPAEGLADLFDDDTPIAAGPDEGLPLFDDEATAKEEVPGESSKPVKSVPPPWPAGELSPFSDEDEEVTGSFSAADVAQLEAQVAESDLAAEPPAELVAQDDVVLELDEGELELDATPGLISRILGRK